MPFESLSDRLSEAFKKISGKGTLTEKNMDIVLQDIRKALLEADVNFRVVKQFLENIKEKALGENVIKSVDPAQMVVKIVHDEIVALLGTSEAEINYKANGITTIMMVGLQGTGKTTSVAKIANVIRKKQNRKPFIIAADIIRPAAIEQLQTLGKEIDVEVFTLGTSKPAVEAVREGMKVAKEKGYDTVLIDTAGRLHIDEELMNELSQIKELVEPDEILLTVDAMTGQDIINVAATFHQQLNVTGLVVTKLDGDARGGAVLSVRSVTDVPVKFVGQGEKIEDLDIFYPERMADRILGMGDIVSFVEQAQDKMDMEATEKSAQRMMEGQFTLDDMLLQMEQVNKLGPLKSVMNMIPGLNKLTKDIDGDLAEKEMSKKKAIILSMTKEERENPSIIRASRKSRIANGSGVSTQEVGRLISDYDKMKEQMRYLSRMMKNQGVK